MKIRIENALEARFYILRESGPTGFLVKQEDEEKKYKVHLAAFLIKISQVFN